MRQNNKSQQNRNNQSYCADVLWSMESGVLRRQRTTVTKSYIIWLKHFGLLLPRRGRHADRQTNLNTQSRPVTLPTTQSNLHSIPDYVMRVMRTKMTSTMKINIIHNIETMKTKEDTQDNRSTKVDPWSPVRLSLILFYCCFVCFLMIIIFLSSSVVRRPNVIASFRPFHQLSLSLSVPPIDFLCTRIQEINTDMKH